MEDEPRIAAWDAKFAYEQWRPVTALRAGGDPGWTPLLVTPPFPDYPAAHTTFAGAAEVVLTAMLGASRPLRLTSPTAGGAQHRYATFAAVADEVENARVWGGVHFRSSSTAGRRLGRRVGDVVLHLIQTNDMATVCGRSPAARGARCATRSRCWGSSSPQGASG